MKRWLCLMVAAMLLMVSLGGCGGGSSYTVGGNANVDSESSGTDSESGSDSEDGTAWDEGTGLPISSTKEYSLTLKSDGSVSAASVSGQAVVAATSLTPFNFVRHIDPDHIDEYYTEGTAGDEVDASAIASAVSDYAVYVTHDIVYMPEGLSFTKQVANDEEQEWASYYSDSVAQEAYATYGFGGPYIFSTLPSTSDASTMTHSVSKAYQNRVLHITQPGTYTLSGTWKGQIWVDLEEPDNGFTTDDTVTLILNGLTVTCDVAPALVFHDLYECGPTDSASVVSFDVGAQVASNAGAQVVIADGTTNSFTGCNVYRMLKAQPKKDTVTTIDGTDVDQQKKRWKMDGAFYSFVSMAIRGGSAGTGVLNITSSTYEGLDAELHMTLSSGTVNVTAPDDGINVNEDNVSVFTQLGGTLSVISSGTDGIDSNGYIVIKSGKLTITSAGSEGGMEAPMDADLGYYVDSSVDYTFNPNGAGGGAPGGENPGGTPGGEPGGGTPPGGL